MATVRDWQKPMEEALEKILLSDTLSVEELAEARKAMSMLDAGSDGVSRVAEQLESRGRKMEDDYQTAVKSIESSETISSVQKAVIMLKTLGNYKEAADRIRQGEEAVERLKRQKAEEEERERKRARKRKIIAWASVGAALLGLVIFCIIGTNQRTQRIEELKTQAAALAEQVGTQELKEVFRELKGMGVSDSELRPITRTALEETAKSVGPAEALTLLDWFAEEMPLAMKSSEFYTWTEERIEAGDFSARESWAYVREALERKDMSPDSAAARKAYGMQMTAVAEQEGKKEDTDWKAWAKEMGPYFETIPADPETALRLSYAVIEAREDPKEIFPAGILLDLPLGEHVGTFTEDLPLDERTWTDPDMAKILPISIQESTEDGNGKPIHTRTYSREKALEEAVRENQRKDSRYSVCLMPEYLASLGEEVRASSFEECTAYAAMQRSWFMSGCVYKTTTYTPGKYGTTSITERLTGSRSDFRAFFSAVDAVVIYDKTRNGALQLLYLKEDKPTIASDTWFSANKDSVAAQAAENCLGNHDTAALRDRYEIMLQLLSPGIMFNRK